MKRLENFIQKEGIKMKEEKTIIQKEGNKMKELDRFTHKEGNSYNACDTTELNMHDVNEVSGGSPYSIYERGKGAKKAKLELNEKAVLKGTELNMNDISKISGGSPYSIYERGKGVKKAKRNVYDGYDMEKDLNNAKSFKEKSKETINIIE